MKQAFKEHFIALLAFSVITVFMALPVILNMNTSIAGTGGDPWQTMWRFETKSHLLDGSSGIPESTKRIAEEFFGFGAPHLTNLSVWPWMIFHLLFGQPLAYNILWLLHFILAGYAMALLVKVLTNRSSILEPAPLLAGIAYMTMPYHIAHSLGHFGAMQLEWIPFIVVSAIVFFRTPTLTKAILLGILLTIQAWVEHHYIVWIALFALIAAFIYRKELRLFIFPSQERGKRTSLLLALSGILVMGILLPFIPTIRLASENNEALALGVDQTIRFSADLFSFITPPPYHPVWGSAFNALFGQYFTGNEAESVQYLGLSLILAIAFFHRHIPVKQKRLWVTTILFFGILSLGPVLHIFGKETSLPLPYALLANLPVFSAIRVISRAGVMVSFATALLFGWVIATNLHRKQTSYIIGALILLEFLFFPFPMQSAKLSPVYNALTSIPGKTVIEIPAATNYVAASRSLYASSIHGKEALGSIALERGQHEDAYDLVKSIPGIRQLLYLRTTELTENRNEFFNQNIRETLPDAMKYLDAHAIIVHSDSLSAVQNTAITSLLERIPGYTKKSFGDALLYTFTTPSTSSDGIFAVRGEGWENIGYDPKRESVFAEVPQKASLSIINVRNTPVSIKLSFLVSPDSSNGIAIRDESYNILQSTEAGSIFTYSLSLQPGVATFAFTPTGDTKAIIQNPQLSILP